MCRLNSVPPPGCNISTCCLVQSVRVLPSLFMYARLSLHWALCCFLPLLPYLPGLSRQKGAESSCRAADWLSWRLSKIVWLYCVCVAHNGSLWDSQYRVVGTASGRLTNLSVVVLKHSVVSTRLVRLNVSFSFFFFFAFVWALCHQRWFKCWNVS